MTTNELKQRIENVDFTFIQFIREETKLYSNKVILFSTIIVLLSLKIISISEFEFDGFKVEIKEYTLVGILALVNIYFYLQFSNSIKIDSLMAKLPNEMTSITEEILTRTEEETKKLNQIAEKHRKILDLGKANEKTKEDFFKEIEELSKEKTLELLTDWKETYAKLIKSHKNNKNLYIYFPNLCFWAANLTFISSVIIWIKAS